MRALIVCLLIVCTLLVWALGVCAARAADPPASTQAPAPAANPATAQELPQVVVIANAPLSGLGLPANEIPANVQTADSRQMQRQQSLDLADYLNAGFSGVSASGSAADPFRRERVAGSVGLAGPAGLRQSRLAERADRHRPQLQLRRYPSPRERRDAAEHVGVPAPGELYAGSHRESPEFRESRGLAVPDRNAAPVRQRLLPPFDHHQQQYQCQRRLPFG